jgi:hypothetical protein
MSAALEDARISWLRMLLIATAAALPFVALSQALAYPSVLLTIWILIRDPKRLALCPRWHWAFALVFVLFCAGSAVWGVEGTRSLSRLHRLSLLLLIPAVPIAFAGRSPLPLVGGTRSRLGVERCVRHGSGATRGLCGQSLARRWPHDH